MTLPAKKTEKTTSPLICSRCEEFIGNLVIIAGEELIQIGTLVVAEIDGNCARCGQEFHYSLNARRLEKIIHRVEERRTTVKGG